MVNILDWKREEYKEISFVIGGTGITPAYQIMLSAAANEDHKTKFKLIYCNKSERDILLKDEIEGLKDKLDLQVSHVIGPGQNGEGELTESMVKTFLGEATEDKLFYFCGNNKMKESVTEIKNELGFQRTFGI